MNTNRNLKSIMMVEDDLDIQIITKFALETIGNFEVMALSSGYEAIKNIEKFNPDLVLLDVMMPEIDGVTTFKRLREIKACQSIPIIFVSAKVQCHEVDEYYQLGALSVLSKPFDPMTLPKKIMDLWAYSNE